MLALAACGGHSVNDGGGALVGKAPLSLGASGSGWFGPLASGIDADTGLDWKAMLGNVVYVEFGFLR